MLAQAHHTASVRSEIAMTIPESARVPVCLRLHVLAFAAVSRESATTRLPFDRWEAENHQGKVAVMAR